MELDPNVSNKELKNTLVSSNITSNTIQSKINSSETENTYNKHKDNSNHSPFVGLKTYEIYNHFKPSISAGTASFLQCTFFYWCDIGKNRLQAGKKVSLKDLIKYNGFKIALLYIVSARSIGFGIFETCKRLLMQSKKYSYLGETQIHFICATITATSKPIFLFPIETMKILMQVREENTRQSFNSMLKLSTKFKLKSLFYLQLKNFASYFSWFETRKQSTHFFKSNFNNALSKTQENFFVGGLSSLSSFILSSPFSTLKTIRQLSMNDRVKDLLRGGGLFRLHKGYVFHFTNIIAGGGVFNIVYSNMMEIKKHF